MAANLWECSPAPFSGDDFFADDGFVSADSVECFECASGKNVDNSSYAVVAGTAGDGGGTLDGDDVRSAVGVGIGETGRRTAGTETGGGRRFFTIAAIQRKIRCLDSDLAAGSAVVCGGERVGFECFSSPILASFFPASGGE